MFAFVVPKTLRADCGTWCQGKSIEEVSLGSCTHTPTISRGSTTVLRKRFECLAPFGFCSQLHSRLETALFGVGSNEWQA